MFAGRPVVVVGRLMHEPKLRGSGPGGMPFVRMKLALARRREQEDETATVEASIRGQLAEICGSSLRKGQSVAVSGSLRVHQVKAAGGKGHPRLEVVADRVQLLKLPKEARYAVSVR